MGRGPSQLQKVCLQMALVNVGAEGPNRGDVDLYLYEVLHEVYGFPIRFERLAAFWKLSPWAAPSGYVPRSWLAHGHLFDKARIGRKRYDAARIAVVRAFMRLERRGLVKRVIEYVGDEDDGRTRGLRLTPAGMKVAMGLSVTLSYRCRKPDKIQI
jgi:hypothetical protein